MTSSRRSFIRTGSTVLSGLAVAPHLLLPSRRDHDLVIRGGTVFDGLGNAGIEADLAITSGRVAAIGRRISERGTFEIDARGLAVCPGFVDIHSHGDGSLWDDPRAESLVRQGITTIVVGQDGSSRAPRDPTDDPDDARHQFATFADLWAGLAELRPAVNVASMIGLGSVRASVVGSENRPATPEQIARMTTLVREALEAGACGASTGLEYTPGGFASREELIALSRPLATHRLPYATHMRNEADELLEAIDESIAIARGAGCALQISHLKTEGPRNWHKLNDVFARVERAGRDGLDIAFDRYPYIAYQTGLSALFPIWSRDGSTDAFLGRLDDSTTGPRIRAETLGKIELIGGWENVLISGVSNADDKPAEGQRLGAYASARGVDPYELAIGLLKRNRGSVGMVGFAMSEENLERILAHPHGMVCSDGGSFALEGPARRGHPHPRSLGTFPRVLGRYVRERRALTLPQAVHKMTGLPASRVRLADRGRIVVGAAGDVVVFDANVVEDRATFAEPFAYPVGIKAVVVNGVVSLLDGSRGDQRGGTPLRLARAQRS
jgi:N-acyl-D-amino-acid deacylase